MKDIDPVINRPPFILVEMWKSYDLKNAYELLHDYAEHVEKKGCSFYSWERRKNCKNRKSNLVHIHVVLNTM